MDIMRNEDNIWSEKQRKIDRQKAQKLLEECKRKEKELLASGKCYQRINNKTVVLR